MCFLKQSIHSHILASTLLSLPRACCNCLFSQFRSLRKRAAWLLYSKIPTYLLDDGYVPGNKHATIVRKFLQEKEQKHRTFRNQSKYENSVKMI